MFNYGKYYKFQAASDDALANPFLLSDQQEQSQQLFKNEPPMRPPPPHSSTASPAHVMQIGGGQPKSAFDDLNDTIRMALTGSPSKGGVAQPGVQQQQFTSTGGVLQQQFSSPAKQPISGGLLKFFFFI